MCLSKKTELLTSGLIKGLEISLVPHKREYAIPSTLGLNIALLPENARLEKLTESGPGEGVSGMCDIFPGALVLIVLSKSEENFKRT